MFSLIVDARAQGRAYRQRLNRPAAPLADEQTPGTRSSLRPSRWHIECAAASRWAPGRPASSESRCCTCVGQT